MQSRKAHSPTIIKPSADLCGENPRFLVDSGSELNLVRADALKETVIIDKNKLCGLTGISENIVQTLGVVKIKLLDIQCEMHVVPNDFPIPWDGILGVQFLKQQNATLNFSDDIVTLNNGEIKIPIVDHEIIVLPARSQTLVALRVRNGDTGSGYIPRINAGPRVFLGECLADNIDGKAKFYAFNTTFKDVTLILPPVTLEKYETHKNSIKYTKQLNKEEAQEKLDDRIKRVLDSLDLSTLNKDEKDNVEYIVSKFPYQFNLPGDKIGCTTAAEHKINTNGHPPVNVKPYKYPPVVREEI